MSGTRPPANYIRRGEEGVRASDLGPSENQTITTQTFSRIILKLDLDKQIMYAQCIHTWRHGVEPFGLLFNDNVSNHWMVAGLVFEALVSACIIIIMFL